MVNKNVLLAVVAGMLMTGCAVEHLEKFNRDLEAFNTAMSSTKAGPPLPQAGASVVMPTLAVKADAKTQTQLVVPNDARTQAVVDAALPTIKKILSIHQCLKNGGMRQLNFYGIPGVNFDTDPSWMPPANSQLFPNSAYYMKYHDRNKCLSVRAIDNISMPALNALKIRVVYFADDSGETVNFIYLLQKTDDHNWKLVKVAQESMFF